MPLMILSRNPGTESEMWPNPFSPKGLFGSRKKWELGNLGTESGLGVVSAERCTAANSFFGLASPSPSVLPARLSGAVQYYLWSEAHTQSSSYLPPSASVRTAPAPPDFQPVRDCAIVSQARKFIPAIDRIDGRRPLTARVSGWFSSRPPSSMLVSNAA